LSIKAGLSRLSNSRILKKLYERESRHPSGEKPSLPWWNDLANSISFQDCTFKGSLRIIYLGGLPPILPLGRCLEEASVIIAFVDDACPVIL
jgi:hypothetical protein